MTLAKIQVTAIFLMEDMEKNFSPKFLEICMETRCWCPSEMGTNMAAGNQQKHLALSLLQKGELMELKNVK